MSTALTGPDDLEEQEPTTDRAEQAEESGSGSVAESAPEHASEPDAPDAPEHAAGARSASASDDGSTEIVAGRYELGPVIGRGGSASVHRAWDRHCERPVALKLFAAGVTGPDRYRQDQELRTLSQLEHPGLVALFDAGTDADTDRPYLVMQLVNGPSLTGKLVEGPLPVPEVVDVGRHLASALRYVHEHGITHRDVKPANVLLEDGRVPLLADFGIALLVDTTRVTTTDAVVGTAAYMAPEQLRGETVGPAADVYALGLVLLESITGKRAFPGTSTESVIARLHHGPAVPPDLAGGVTPLIERMTALDPAQRPDARAVVGELGTAADRIADPDGDHPAPMVAPVDATTTTVPRAAAAATGWPSRRTVLVTGLAGLVVTLGVVGAVVGALTHQPTPAAGTAPLPVAVSPASPAAAAPITVPVGAPVVPAAPPAPAVAAAPGVGQAPSPVARPRAQAAAPPPVATRAAPPPARRAPAAGRATAAQGAGAAGTGTAARGGTASTGTTSQNAGGGGGGGGGDDSGKGKGGGGDDGGGSGKGGGSGSGSGKGGGGGDG